jgi:hypothetical protein
VTASTQCRSHSPTAVTCVQIVQCIYVIRKLTREDVCIEERNFLVSDPFPTAVLRGDTQRYYEI